MGEVLPYRDHQKAVDRWSNMERVKLVEQLLTEDNLPRTKACLERFEIVADTAPSEWTAPESDSA